MIRCTSNCWGFSSHVRSSHFRVKRRSVSPRSTNWCTSCSLNEQNRLAQVFDKWSCNCHWQIIQEKRWWRIYTHFGGDFQSVVKRLNNTVHITNRLAIIHSLYRQTRNRRSNSAIDDNSLSILCNTVNILACNAGRLEMSGTRRRGN